MKRFVILEIESSVVAGEWEGEDYLYYKVVRVTSNKKLAEYIASFNNAVPLDTSGGYGFQAAYTRRLEQGHSVTRVILAGDEPAVEVRHLNFNY